MPAGDRIEDRDFAHHQLAWSAFDELARGRAQPAVVLQLRQAERSRRLLLLQALEERLTKDPTLVGPLPATDEFWELLTRAERAAPGGFDKLLAHPYTGAWVGYVTRLVQNQITGVGPIWGHAGHLHALAAAAAIRARIAFSTRIPVWDGHAILPTIGMADLVTDEAWSVAEVRGDRDHMEISNQRGQLRVPRVGSGDFTNWWGIRTIAAEHEGLRLSVRLDDLDPYRGLTEPVSPQRLTRAEVAGWRDMFGAAWRLVVRCLPDLAKGIPVGLDSLVPLPTVPFRNQSGSTGEAFGSAIIARPADAESLAATLVHEFHHNLLGGLLHLIPLYDYDPTKRFYTLWRDDPRPVGGTLNGLHAFFGVTAFWRALSRLGAEAPDRRAAFEFAFWRTGTWRTLRSLSGDASLTGAGQRFVDGIAETLAPWLDEPLPEDAAELAASAVADHRAGWRIRYLRPRSATVNRYTDSWLAGRPWPSGLESDADLTPIPVPDGSWSGARTALIRISLTVAKPEVQNVWADVPDDTTQADLAYVSGHAENAVQLYRRELAENPDRPASWIGLGLALAARGGDSAGARALRHRPELVRAVHREVLARTRKPPEPEKLADWIGRSVC